MLAASGSLLVSTTEGKIYCFRPEGSQRHGEVLPGTRELDTPVAAKEGAAKLLSASGIREGYCLVLGSLDVSLLAELAAQSELTIYFATEEKEVDESRRRLDAAGLYGTRVAIHRSSYQPLPYADYFANLVLLNLTSVPSLERIPGRELYRVLRSYGGTAVITFPDNLWPQVQQWLDSSGIPRGEWQYTGGKVRITRRHLPSAGVLFSLPATAHSDNERLAREMQRIANARLQGRHILQQNDEDVCSQYIITRANMTGTMPFLKNTSARGKFGLLIELTAGYPSTYGTVLQTDVTCKLCRTLFIVYDK